MSSWEYAEVERLQRIFESLERIRALTVNSAMSTRCGLIDIA